MSLDSSILIDTLEDLRVSTENGTLCTEEEICRRLQVLLSNFRAKRNSHLPVFRLPPEILLIIFTHGAREHFESADGYNFTPCVPTWVNVSYVCSHWRNIALGSPTLWAYHFNVSLRWTEEILLRSKQAPLMISVYPYHQYREISWWPSLLDLLLKHSERLRHLNIPIPPANFSLRAPHLETLVMGQIHQGIPKQSIEITDGDKLPLSSLYLFDCSLPWHSLNLTGLKTLALRNVDSPSPPNMFKFLAILSGMQNLIILTIENVLPSARDFLSSGGVDVSPKANLPRLEFLTVKAPLSTVIALISCVNIPSETKLDLAPLFESGSFDSDYAPISPFLKHRFSQQSSDLVFRSLLLSTACPTASLSFGFYIDRDTNPTFSLEAAYEIALRITIGGVEDEGLRRTQWTYNDILRNIRNILCSLPLTNIQCVHFLWPQFSREDWGDILKCLEGLRYMKLSYGPLPDMTLLCAGEQDIPDRDPPSGQTFVPALEELVLYQIVFVPDDHPQCPDGGAPVDLFDALATRKGLKVTMTDCRFIHDGRLQSM